MSAKSRDDIDLGGLTMEGPEEGERTISMGLRNDKVKDWIPVSCKGLILLRAALSRLKLKI
jgi:hypothetical protein